MHADVEVVAVADDDDGGDDGSSTASSGLRAEEAAAGIWVAGSFYATEGDGYTDEDGAWVPLSTQAKMERKIALAAAQADDPPRRPLLTFYHERAARRRRRLDAGFDVREPFSDATLAAIAASEQTIYVDG